MNHIKFSILILSTALLMGCNPDKYDYIDIPDAYFLDALKRNDVDKNGDGQISKHEAEETERLFIGPSGIKSLKGIEAFCNLDTLDLSLNNIDSLDFSENLNLNYLHCYSCEIAHLNIRNNHSLSYLNASRNKMPTLDLSQNTELITALLTNNNFTDLDVSQNTKLSVLMTCGNDLEYLDVSHNTTLTKLGVDNMPQLTEVCVWTLPFPPEGVKVVRGFSPNINFVTCN